LVGAVSIKKKSLALPTVNDGIESALKKKLIIRDGFPNWSAEDYRKFVNTTVNYTYRGFHFSNLNDVLANGTKPILNEVGPWSVIETDFKYDLSFGTDDVGEYYQYRQWWNKTWATDEDRIGAYTTPLTTFNPAFLGIMGNFPTLACNPAAQETSVQAKLAPKGLAGIYNLYTNDQTSFTSALIKVSAVAAMYRGYAAKTELYTNSTFNGTVNAVWSGQQTPIFLNDSHYDDASFIVQGFTPYLALSGNFWTSSFPFAFNNMATGAGFWATMLTTGGVHNSTAAKSYINAIANATGSNAFAEGSLTTLYTWLTGIIASSGPNLVYFLRNDAIFGGTASTCVSPTTLKDMALCQLTTGWFARVLTSGYSMVDLDPTSASYLSCKDMKRRADTANSRGTYGFVGCVGPELAAAQNAAGAYVAALAFTPSEATNFYNMTFTTIGAIASALTYAGANPSDALSAIQYVDRTFGTYGFTLARFGVGGSNYFKFLLGYATKYVPNSIVWPQLDFDSDALLFVRHRAPVEIMFGYTPVWLMRQRCNVNMSADPSVYVPQLRLCSLMYQSAINGSYLGVSDALLMGNSDPTDPQYGILVYEGILSNWTSKEFQNATAAQGTYAFYNGNTNIAQLGLYKHWRSVSKFKSLGDIPSQTERTPTKKGGCTCIYTEVSKNTPGPVNMSYAPICNKGAAAGYCNSTCPDVYTDYEDLQQTGTGTQMQPFLYKDSQRENTLELWSSEAMRVVKLNYLQDSTVKGIKTRRYVLDATELRNSTDFAYAAKYKYPVGDPNGIADLAAFFGNIPVALTRPYFVSGDPKLDLTYGITDFTAQRSTSMYTVNPLPVSSLLDYETYVDVEPTTGLTLQGHKRLQYTLKLDASVFNSPYYVNLFNPANTWHYYNSATNTTSSIIYLPGFWADEWGLVSDDDAKSFRNGVYGSRVLAERLEIGGYAIGGFLFLFGFAGASFFILDSPDKRMLQSVPSRTNI